jgi:PD-(D/E)XK nuclease superfamily
VRFSSLDQLFACPGYTSIERDFKREDEEFPNAVASREWGTMVHTWKETGKIVHPAGDDREERLLGNRIWKSAKNNREAKIEHETYWPMGGYHELRIAYHWREHYSEISFDKSEDFHSRFKDDEWITGTVDYVLDADGKLRVSDLKTGKWWNKKPDESKQIMGYGTGIYSSSAFPDYGYTSLEVVHWPKYPAKQPPVVMEATVSSEELVAFGKRIEEKMETRGQEFNPSVENCRFCPGRFNCMFAVKEEKEYGW